jgi:hypothetical protein
MDTYSLLLLFMEYRIQGIEDGVWNSWSRSQTDRALGAAAPARRTVNICGIDAR